jgi:hypothetical protein
MAYSIIDLDSKIRISRKLKKARKPRRKMKKTPTIMLSLGTKSKKH